MLQVSSTNTRAEVEIVKGSRARYNVGEIQCCTDPSLVDVISNIRNDGPVKRLHPTRQGRLWYPF